jgi:signal transduction histidine kinase
MTDASVANAPADPVAGPGPAPIARKQVLLTVVLTAGASFVVFLPGFPFDRRFAAVSVASALLNLVLFLAFPLLRRSHFLLLVFANIALMGFSIHFTGGIMSPFILILACLLMVAEASNLHHPALLPAVLASYVSVVGLEYFGVLSPGVVAAADVYRSPSTTLWVGLATVCFLGVSGMLYDMIVSTLRRRVEAEHRQRQQVQLMMSSLDAHAQLGGMVARIAHDIHGPLSAINGFVQLLAENTNLDGETKEDCRVILDETARIAKMIEKMLRFAKPGDGGTETLCPRQLMETILSVIRFHPKARGIRFETRFEAPGTLRVRGSKDALQQVYFNIVKNAMEALEGCRGAEVRVSVSTDDGFCRLSVDDNGPGIPAEVLRKLREGQHSTKPGGSGLGLTIAREILQLHGGDLELRARPDSGVSVVTRLPVLRA